MSKKLKPKVKVTAPAINSKTQELAKYHVNTTGRKMTTDQGILVEHTDDSLKAGSRGPSLLEDFHLREKNHAI